MIQIVAKLRRVAAFTAALTSLSVLSPGASHAQSPPPPPPADTTARPAAADTTAKPAVQPAPSAGATAAPAPSSTSATSGKSGKSGKSSKSSKSSTTTSGSAPAKPPKASKPKAPKAAAAAIAVPGKSYEERRKEDGVYAKGANWLGLRFGYANRTGDLSGDGFIGYGMSYTRMLSNRYAFSAGINHDIVGHFAEQIDVAVPFTAEFQRVFKAGGEMRTYVGLGGGYYYRKFYRTGSEYNTATAGGGHVSLGITSQLDDKHVVGFETRVAWIKGRPGVTNPTFGVGTDTETIWTAKLTWALVY